MPRRHVALCDRDKTSEARFRSEQIVTVGIETALGDAISNREKLACGVEKKIELHSVEHLSDHRGEIGYAALEGYRGVRGAFDRGEHRVDSRNRAARVGLGRDLRLASDKNARRLFASIGESAKGRHRVEQSS